jgi:hypothetical protein
MLFHRTPHSLSYSQEHNDQSTARRGGGGEEEGRGSVAVVEKGRKETELGVEQSKHVFLSIDIKGPKTVHLNTLSKQSISQSGGGAHSQSKS